MSSGRNLGPNQFAFIWIARQNIFFTLVVVTQPVCAIFCPCDWNQWTIVIVILKDGVFLLERLQMKSELAQSGANRRASHECKMKKKAPSKSVNDLQKNCVYWCRDYGVQWLYAQMTVAGEPKEEEEEEWNVVLMKNVKHIANDISKNTYH